MSSKDLRFLPHFAVENGFCMKSQFYQAAHISKATATIQTPWWGGATSSRSNASTSPGSISFRRYARLSFWLQTPLLASVHEYGAFDHACYHPRHRQRCAPYMEWRYHQQTGCCSVSCQTGRRDRLCDLTLYHGQAIPGNPKVYRTAEIGRKRIKDPWCPACYDISFLTTTTVNTVFFPNL